MEHVSLPQPVLIEKSGAVLTFTLNNPDAANEITGPMFDAMIAALRSEAIEPTARVLRLRAVGNAFCKGRERAGRDPVSIHAEVARLIELKKLVRSSSLISVAEVQGDAFGFGFGLAILCDFAIVSSAARLAFPEMKAGLPPAAIMAYLGRYALPKRVFPMVLFGEPMTPAVALDAGLITQIAEPDTLNIATDTLIERILALNEAGARDCKAFFQSVEENALEQNFRFAAETLTVTTMRLLQSR